MNQNKLPRLSVVIPVFNNPEGITQTLKELTKCIYSGPVEIIVVDNASSDSTRDAIKKFPVKYLFEKKPGSYAARNLGISHSRGEIIAFTDSDCWPDPDWINAGYLAFKRDTSAVAGQIKFTYVTPQPNIYEYLDSVKKLNQKAYVKKGFAATANLFVRKSIFNTFGMFNENLKSGGDYEFCRRFTRVGEHLVYCPDAVIYHPARKTLPQLIKKTRRIGQGQKTLIRMGLLQHDRGSLLKLLPTISVPKKNYWSQYGFAQKLKIIVTANLLKYINYYYRIF